METPSGALIAIAEKTRSHLSRMSKDVFTEPSNVDPDTLRNLGPLRPLAGIWRSTGDDVHPVAEGSKSQAFVDRIELQPIDPQTNGPQLFYGLRYRQHIVRPGEVETFHPLARK